MYTAVYSVAICLVFVGIVLFFVLKGRRDKQIAQRLKSGEKIKPKTEKIVKSPIVVEEKTEEKVVQQTPEQAQLEDYSWDGGAKQEAPKPAKNPFNIFDEESEDEDEADEDLDEKFAEYEKFLRKNLNLDDEEDEFEENSDEFRGGNSDGMKKVDSLPPKMKDVFMDDLLKPHVDDDLLKDGEEKSEEDDEEED